MLALSIACCGFSPLLLLCLDKIVWSSMEAKAQSATLEIENFETRRKTQQQKLATQKASLERQRELLEGLEEKVCHLFCFIWYNLINFSVFFIFVYFSCFFLFFSRFGALPPSSIPKRTSVCLVFRLFWRPASLNLSVYV